MIVTPTQSQTMAALLTVLSKIVPSGTPIMLGQSNRVPEPSETTFIVMTPLRRPRLATNLVTFDDCKFLGTVSGSTLTVTTLDYGTIQPGRNIWGVGITDGTTIIQQNTGPTGGLGTYTLSAPFSIPSTTLMAAGALNIMTEIEFDVQIDLHGDGATTQVADNAQMISSVFRDDWAVEQFAALRSDVIPLYADDPVFMPGFVNGEQLYEDRWIVEAKLQVNAVVSVPQQFMDTTVVGLIDVDVWYAP